jgi:hypothetical protein
MDGWMDGWIDWQAGYTVETCLLRCTIVEGRMCKLAMARLDASSSDVVSCVDSADL